MHAEDRNSESSFIIALSVALFAVFYSEKGSAQNSLELLDIFNPDALNSCGLGLNSKQQVNPGTDIVNGRPGLI